MPEEFRSIKDQSITRTARSFGSLIPMETRSNFGSQKFGTTKIRNDNEGSYASILSRGPLTWILTEIHLDLAGRYDEAIEQRRKVLELNPNDASQYIQLSQS